MWIKQVILDGFKSYAHRTVVGPFDREFNAITGLNGSGKSNVLDAICFVFAISNLQKVRVRDLRELIYKSGQAGISKASVTIDFDNTDAATRPPGYPDCDTITVTRQIVVGGRHKSFINGTSKTLSQVQDLFESVQLNVNNPHFLIMQGTITKVLNMKPADRLSMLEEAAGTRLFEQKKQSAQLRVQKKDVRLTEIDRQLDEDMKPTLESREKDRREYDRYLQAKNTVEQLSRMKLAYDYESLVEAVQRANEELTAAKASDDRTARELKDLSETINELSAEIDTLKTRHATSLSFGLGASQKEYDDAAKILIAKQTDLRNTEIEIGKQHAAVQRLERERDTAQRQIKKHEEGVAQAVKDLKVFNEQHDELSMMTDNQTRQLQLLKSGIAASSEGISLTEQLDRFKKQLATCDGQISQSNLVISQAKQQLKVKQGQAKNKDADYAAIEANLQAAKAKLEEDVARAREQAGGHNPEREVEVKKLIRENAPRISQLDHEVQQLETVTKHRLETQYKAGSLPPELQGKVKGVVAKLLTVNDDRYTAAVTQAAGGALYNVIVDTELTGQRVMKEVKNRVTIIPLNKIQDQVCSKATCETAARAAESVGGTATLALDVLGYPEDVKNAMRFVFGRKFLCTDLDSATKVTFHKDVRQVAVTLDGEVVQPGGIMQGGSTRELDKTLFLYSKYLARSDALAAEKAEMAVLEKELSNLLKARSRYDDQQQALDQQRRKVDSLAYSLSTNQQHQIAEAMANLEKKIAEAEEQKAGAKVKGEKLRGEIKELESEVRKGSDITQKKREVEQSIAGAKLKMKTLQPKRIEAQRAVAEADATRAEMTSDLDRFTAEKADEEAKLKDMRKAADRLKRDVTVQKETAAEKEETMRELKDKLTQANSGVASKQRELSSLKDREGDVTAMKERTLLRLKELSATFDARTNQLKAMEKSSFVIENKENFNKRNTEFDWRSINHKQEFAKLEALRVQQAKMSKTVNHKVVAMYENVEAQYKDVLEKREQVQRDREHFVKTIDELDDMKKTTVAETFARVATDFSAIFSSLLPGANAALHPEKDNAGMITGISIRVAMGNNWKNSLTELSGGQRSLLALSYILALLKYKPAPVYILDEVDAALDLSHTQNIGKMLANHFKNSQFLVVSLKEGMFNNANVLFRVRLADGQSQ
eukprot:gene10096-15518_t